MKAAAPSRRRVAAPASQTVNWVIKASKLCNLRCSYCYEWDELADRRRMSLAVWERMLHMIREYHERRARESGRFQTCLIWHGGEPTVLPRAYFEEVMALQHRILGSQALQDESYYNALQTNLYRLPEDKLELFKRERFRLGVSFDVVGGVRVTADGRESEDRVAANMDLLRGRDIQVGAITVLAAHTAPHIKAIYDFYHDIRMNFRVLPVFDAPNNRPGASFALDAAEMSRAMCRLFDHWAKRRDRVLVAPLDDYARTAWLHLTGGRQGPYEREKGEWAIIVNTDGTLFQVRDAYAPAKALGNVLTHSMEQVLTSDAYRDSLARDRAMFEKHCGGCEFRDACNSFPLFESTYPGPHPERCHVAHPVIRHIVRRARAGHYTRAQLREMCGT